MLQAPAGLPKYDPVTDVRRLASLPAPAGGHAYDALSDFFAFVRTGLPPAQRARFDPVTALWSWEGPDRGWNDAAPPRAGKPAPPKRVSREVPVGL